MFLLQVTIIRHTFQYIDFDMFSAYNIGNHTVTLNMSCPCNEMSAWWWLLVTETCSKIHIIEYIVVFWRNIHFGYTTTQRDGSYQIMCYFYSAGFLFTFGTVPQFLRLINCDMLQFSVTKTNKIIAYVCATLGCIREIVKSDYFLRFCPSVLKNSAPTGRICMKFDYESRTPPPPPKFGTFVFQNKFRNVLQSCRSCSEGRRSVSSNYSIFRKFFLPFLWETCRDTQKGHDVVGCCLRITVTRKIPWQLWVSGGIPSLGFYFRHLAEAAARGLFHAPCIRASLRETKERK